MVTVISQGTRRVAYAVSGGCRANVVSVNKRRGQCSTVAEMEASL